MLLINAAWIARSASHSASIDVVEEGERLEMFCQGNQSNATSARKDPHLLNTEPWAIGNLA